MSRCIENKRSALEWRENVQLASNHLFYVHCLLRHNRRRRKKKFFFYRTEEMHWHLNERYNEYPHEKKQTHLKVFHVEWETPNLGRKISHERYHAIQSKNHCQETLTRNWCTWIQIIIERIPNEANDFNIYIYIYVISFFVCAI